MKAKIVNIKEFGHGVLIESANIILLPLFNPHKMQKVITTWDASLMEHEFIGKEAEIEVKWKKLANTLNAVMEEFDNDADKITDSILNAKPI